MTWYGIPGSPRSAELTRAFVTTPSPAEFMLALASRPASTRVTKLGRSSGCSTSSTTTVSNACGIQSQFWASSGRPARVLRDSRARAVHSLARAARCAAASLALAAKMISVRALIASTSPAGSPEPSAMPSISCITSGARSRIGFS